MFLRQNWLAINFPSRRDEVKRTDKRALVPERLTSRRDGVVAKTAEEGRGRPVTAAAVRKRSAEWSREGGGGATSEG